MNRRSFLVSIPFLPAAIKAAAAPQPDRCVINVESRRYTLCSVEHHVAMDRLHHEVIRTDFGAIGIWRDPYFHEAHR